MGQVVTIAKDPHAVAFPDVAPWARQRTDRAEASDPFACAVPDAGTDICTLHTSPSGPVAEWLLCLLAAFCQMGRTVTSARLHDERIELTVDGARLVVGKVAPPVTRGRAYYRPQMPDASRKAGLLGHALSHHAAACRLRIDQQADPEVIGDICGLFVQFHRPVAVILDPARLVLTFAEFGAIPPEVLRHLPRGARIAPLGRRGTRPSTDWIEHPQCASPATLSQPPGLFSHHRSRDKGQATRAAVATLLGKGGQVAKAFCKAKTEREVKSVFRTSPSRGTARDRASSADPFAARPASRAPEPLVCDTVPLSARGEPLRLVAPLLMATMVLLTNLHHGEAGADQRPATEALGGGAALEGAA